MKLPLPALLLPIICMLAQQVSAQIPAFPGAEGFGAHAIGGRGGDVYTVSNLNSSGSGSFSDAIATAPAQGRTIVFAVSGYIPITGSYLDLRKSNITIAGQTAPGDGIGLRNSAFRIFGTNTIVRHVRFRHGVNGTGGDCIDLGDTTYNLLLDHVAMQFSTDENMSSFNSTPDNLTLQWSLNAWGLEPHSAGGLWYVERATTHHSLWAHNHTRDPKALPTGLLDWVNNITFDYEIGFILGDSTEPVDYRANVENCYFICPPGNIRSYTLSRSSTNIYGVPNFSLFFTNCFWDNDGDTVLDGFDQGGAMLSVTPGSLILATNAFARTSGLPVTKDPPLRAYKKIVSQAGPLRLDVNYAGPLRDAVDARLISNLVTQTANQISSETQLTGVGGSGFGTLNSAPAPPDTDGDGMPDYFEDALGWNRSVQDHNTLLANTGGVLSGTTFFPTNTVAGYTRLEEYLFFKAMPHGVVPRNLTNNPSSLIINLAKFTAGFTQTPVFAVSNVIGGSVTLGGTNNSIVTFTPATNTSGRARFEFTVTDAAGDFWTQTCAILVSVAATPRDLLWNGSGSAWDSSSLNWLRTSDSSTVAFAVGDYVTFDQSGIAQSNVVVSGTNEPGRISVNATGHYAFGGSGLIGGGGLTKSGPGILSLTGRIAYTGATIVQGGTLRVGAASGVSTSSTLAASAAITNHGALVFRRTDAADLEIAGRIAGTGTVTYDGNATINQSRYTINDTSTYSGGTFINNARVNLSQTGGLGTGPIVITAGGQVFNNATLVLSNALTISGNGWTESAGQLGALRINSGSVLAGPVTLAGHSRICASSGTITITGAVSGPFALELGENSAAGTVVLAGTNTYSGDTTVSFGALELATNGSLRFIPGTNGACNRVTGSGSATFRGAFVIDTTNASTTDGNTWSLVNVATLTESFASTFNVPGFTELSNVWTRAEGPRTWKFSEATGVLSLRSAPDLLFTSPGSDPVTVSLTSNALHLAVSVSFTGAPPAYAWSVLSGPAGASFDSTNSAAAIVSFTQPGTYVIQFTATVGTPPDTISSTATRTVIVAPPADVALRQGDNGYAHTATLIRGDNTNWNSGARDQLLIGRTTAGLRVLFSYGLETLPAGFYARSAALRIWSGPLIGSGTIPYDINLHRLHLVPTEGTGLGLDANDGTLTGATYVRRTDSTLNSNWFGTGCIAGNPGAGDYAPTPLAAVSNVVTTTTNVLYTFASPALAEAVNDSIDAAEPLSLFAISANTSSNNLYTRFHSDDSTDTSRRPQLVLGFATNLAPAVSTGPAPVAYAGAPAALAGSVTGGLAHLWSTVSGPGSVTFSNPASPTSTATFASAGSYILRLSSTNAHGTTSQTLAVTVSALTQIELWRLQYFGSTSNSGSAADFVDANGDSELNLFEFATHQNPNIAVLASNSFTRNGAVLEFVYTRSKDALSDGILFSVVWSDTLAAGSWSSSGVSEQVLNEDTEIQVVKATVPAGSGNRRFIRLVITKP